MEQSSLMSSAQPTTAPTMETQADALEVPPKATSSMPPPSKIPIMRSSRAMQPLSRSSASSLHLSKPADEKESGLSTTGVLKQAIPTSLPVRRPTTRPTMSAAMSALPVAPNMASITDLEDRTNAPPLLELVSQPVIRRKPSYPSSLGHGPPKRETPRMVSVPVPPHIIDRTPMLSMDTEVESSFAAKASRSVSNPEPRARTSLSMSVRREGWMDTSRSLAGLSDAMEKLKAKKEMDPSRGSLSASTARQSLASTAVLSELQPNTNVPVATGRLSSVHRPRPSSAMGFADCSFNEGDKSLAALMTSTSGGGCLKGVVAFVDVWTADGTDSGGVFVDMLKGLGARVSGGTSVSRAQLSTDDSQVLGRPTESCTHIVYKSGRPATLTWHRKQEDPPHIVGISWVTKSKEAGKRLLEDPYVVDVGKEDVFQKVCGCWIAEAVLILKQRRKSMEPKQLSLMSSMGIGRPSTSTYPAPTCVSAGGLTILVLSANIIEARRKSLVHAREWAFLLLRAHLNSNSKDRVTSEEGLSPCGRRL